MSNWQGRDFFSAGPGGGKPRFKPVVLALPIVALLLFNVVTGHVDLINAENTRVDNLLEQKAAIESTIEAERAAAAASTVAQMAPLATPATTPEASNQAVAAECDPSDDGRYCLYVIQEGDSLAAIATRFGLDGGEVTGWELIFESNRPDLAGIENVLEPGWVLRIPRSNAIVHLVLPGDSLTVLAEDYGVSTDAIATENGLVNRDDVQIGDILIIPSPTQVRGPLFDKPVLAEETEETPAQLEPLEDEPAESETEAEAVEADASEEEDEPVQEEQTEEESDATDDEWDITQDDDEEDRQPETRETTERPERVRATDDGDEDEDEDEERLREEDEDADSNPSNEDDEDSDSNSNDEDDEDTESRPTDDEDDEQEPRDESEDERDEQSEDDRDEEQSASDTSEDDEEEQSASDTSEDDNEEQSQSEVSDDNEGDQPEETQQEAAPPEPDDPTRMSWPVVQPLFITNYMTARHPLGMDFGLGANPTSSIMAAAAGTVEFAGGDPCCSYGYYVVVDHGNGLKTLYAHFSSIGVRKGQYVERGQALGIAGNTGNSRGVHLHFEVYNNGTRVDPMIYLPKN